MEQALSEFAVFSGCFMRMCNKLYVVAAAIYSTSTVEVFADGSMHAFNILGPCA